MSLNLALAATIRGARSSQATLMHGLAAPSITGLDRHPPFSSLPGGQRRAINTYVHTARRRSGALVRFACRVAPEGERPRAGGPG